MTTATLEAPAEATTSPASITETKRSITDLRQQSDDAYRAAVNHAADTGEAPAGWEQIVSAASRTRDEFLQDVDRENRRRDARAELAQAEELAAEVADLDTKYVHLAAERDAAEAELIRKHELALERVRKPAAELEAEANNKRHAARSMREQAERTLRSLVSKEAADAAKARIEALESERAGILNARAQDGMRGVVPGDLIRSREDARLEQIGKEIERLANLWRNA